MNRFIGISLNYSLVVFAMCLAAVLDSGTVYAKLQGQAKVDSMFKELPRQKEDTDKVKLLCGLSRGLSFIDPDKGIIYGQKGLELSRKLNWSRGVARANSIIGTNYQNKSEYTRALEYFKVFLKLNEEAGDKKGMAEGNRSIGNNHFFQNDNSKALEYYFKALKMYESEDVKQDIASTNINIGAVYFNLSNYPKALEYYFKALKPSEESGNRNALSVVTGNIGNVYVRLEDYPKALEYYFKALQINKDIGDRSGVTSITSNIGAIYQLQGNLQKALEYYLEALRLCEEIGYQKGIAANTKNVAIIYAEQKEYNMALENFTKALRIAEDIGRKSEIASVFTGMGNVYLDIYDGPSVKASADKTGGYISGKTAQLQKAIEYLERGLAVAKEIEEPEMIYPCYSSLAKAYKLKGDYKNALHAADNYRAIRDSLFSKENSKKIMQQEMRYEYEKKEAVAKVEQEKRDVVATKELQKQKWARNGFMGGFAVVLVFAGIFLNQRNKISLGKRQSDALLLNILPAEVAEELKEKGASEARLMDDVTVLFTDFKDFTLISENLSPKDLVAEINVCFSAFDEIMAKNGVEKIKTVGDAYMAAGGLPVANATHAADVVKAAIDIQAFVRKHRAGREAEGKHSFEIRIGVHTGPVVAGIVGVKKFQYDIWGDTVNTAARMEQHGEAGKINISQATYDLVKNEFPCTHRGKIAAKGKGEVDMYFVE